MLTEKIKTGWRRLKCDCVHAFSIIGVTSFSGITVNIEAVSIATSAEWPCLSRHDLFTEHQFKQAEHGRGLCSSQTLLGFCWMVGKRSRQDRLFLSKNSKRLKRSSKATFGPDYHKASFLNEGFLKFFQRSQGNPPSLIEPRWFRSFTEVIKKKP